MKLTSAWVDQTQDQFNVQLIPDDHPSAQTLNEVFGEHTFFLGKEGLHIVEPAASAQAGAPAGDVVRLASWADPKQTTLEPHSPQRVGVVVIAGAAPN